MVNINKTTLYDNYVCFYDIVLKQLPSICCAKGQMSISGSIKRT